MKTIPLLAALLLTGCASIDRAIDAPRQNRAQSFVASNPDLDENVKRNIVEGRVLVGMTKDQAKAAWGEPTRKNLMGGQHGDFEQWVYPYAYLYFRGGKVTSWQVTE